jgi:transposase InsO family protein
MKYKFITENKDTFTVKRMCHALSIKPSAYYAWSKRGPSKRSVLDDLILKEIKKVYTDSRKRCYGSPRMVGEIITKGIQCGVKKVARIMRVNNLRADIRRKHSYKKSKNTVEYISENILNREFTQPKQNMAWVSDITYIYTKTGWAYLCVFLDLFSKAVVGWSISESANADLVVDAFNKAYLLRHPDKGLIVHSDRGCQYTSEQFKDHLELTGCIQSMSRPGNCWDNACVESFFSHLKSEIIFGEYFDSVEEVNYKVFAYIEGFYNRERRHSSCENLSPIDYENKMIA